MAWSKPSGLCLATGSLLAAGLNLALPHDDDPHRFVALVAESDVWGLLHAGLVVAVLLVAAGLHGVLDATGADGPRRTGLGDGALWVGTGLMLAGLLVAGVAMEKAADDFVGAIPEDRAATFFSVVSFDRLSYALFAGAPSCSSASCRSCSARRSAGTTRCSASPGSPRVGWRPSSAWPSSSCGTWTRRCSTSPDPWP